jgi:phosphoglycerol transferase MdoB-like AlkP superfamily enzyme
MQYAVNFFLAFALFFVCRVIFVAANQNFYSEIPFLHYLTLFKGGMKYDFAAIFYLSAVSFVMLILPFKFVFKEKYQKIAKWFFLIPVSLGVFANIFDAAFFPFNARRTNFSFFSEFKNEDNLAGIFFGGLLDYWYLTLAAAGLIFVLVRFYYEPKVCAKDFSDRKYNIKVLPLTFLFIYFFMAGLRGSFLIDEDHRPMNMNNANEYIKKSNESAIVLNTPYCIIRTAGKISFSDPEYFSDGELEKIYSPVHYPQPEEEFKKLNVVILILESFGKEYSGFFNGNEGYTPFLDSLYQEGLTFTNSFATGRKSIDAMPSILAGIPYLTDHFFMGMYSNNRVNSIASLLKAKGYYSAFYHGAPNGSMGFLHFANLAGFQDYFGMTEYCTDSAFNAMDDFDGHWAIWDEEFLQFYAKSMGEIPQPFVTACFTATSHNPFRIPEKYKERFKEGPQPITKCIQYTDNAVRNFFNTMKKYPWFDNTLFVITADHTNQTLSREYTTDRNIFKVPVLFYHAGGNLKKLSEKLFCQTDIPPTILDYLNFDKPYTAFGSSYFNTSDTSGYVVNYNEPLYQISKGKYFLQFDGVKETGFFIPGEDVFLQHNLAGSFPNEETEMLNLLKAEIQQYHRRMIDNRLTAE